MSVVLATAGGMIVDAVVAADGTLSTGAMGGNGAYSAVGASHWTTGVGVIAAIPSNYPAAWIATLSAAGIATDGIVRHGEVVALSEWFFYAPDGSRRDGLYASAEEAATSGVTGERLSPATAAAWEARLAGRKPDGLGYGAFRALHPIGPDQWPAGWTGIEALHLAPERPDRQLALARLARRRGATVSLDPGPHASRLSGELLDALLDTVDLFLPSEKELAILAPGQSPAAAVRALAARGRAMVSAKLGARGSLVHDRRTDKLIEVPALPVAALDPTGAGDAYCGGFLAGWRATGDPVEAACRATVSASIAVEGFGVLHGLSAEPGEIQRRLTILRSRVGASPQPVRRHRIMSTATSCDLLITGGTVITMDPQRRIIEDGAVALSGDRVVAVGTAADLANLPAARRMDAEGRIVLPGLIDAHGHAGHSLLKTIAGDTPGLWGQVVTAVYFHFVTPDFWYAEGRLSALERLKFGVTCGLSVVGSQPRSDDPRFAGAHARAYAEMGLRCVVAVGPCNPPWPRPVSTWDDGMRRQTTFTFEDALAGAGQVIARWHGEGAGRIRVYLTPFVIVPSLDTSGPTQADKAAALTAFDRTQSRRVREVARHHGVRIHSDAFGGMVRLAAADPHGLLGPDVSLQHCTGLGLDEIRILAQTDTRVGHAPMSGSLVKARCPVPELLDAGATVAIVTDGTSPRTSFDLFPQMRAAIRLQQLHFQDMFVMPAGKALEMVTIDAARTLGLESEIGSLEVGKKADVILVDFRQPHLQPAFMPVHRLVYEAAGQDVETVIVDGRILMEGRRVSDCSEADVFAQARHESALVIDRAGLKPFMTPPAQFWSHAHARIDDDRADHVPV